MPPPPFAKKIHFFLIRKFWIRRYPPFRENSEKNTFFFMPPLTPICISSKCGTPPEPVTIPLPHYIRSECKMHKRANNSPECCCGGGGALPEPVTSERWPVFRKKGRKPRWRGEGEATSCRREVRRRLTQEVSEGC